jgi:hypothetical protein
MSDQLVEITLFVLYSIMALICGYAILKSVQRKELLSTLISLTLELALCCKLFLMCRASRNIPGDD